MAVRTHLGVTSRAGFPPRGFPSVSASLAGRQECSTNCQLSCLHALCSRYSALVGHVTRPHTLLGIVPTIVGGASNSPRTWMELSWRLLGDCFAPIFKVPETSPNVATRSVATWAHRRGGSTRRGPLGRQQRMRFSRAQSSKSCAAARVTPLTQGQTPEPPPGAMNGRLGPSQHIAGFTGIRRS